MPDTGPHNCSLLENFQFAQFILKVSIETRIILTAKFGRGLRMNNNIDKLLNSGELICSLIRKKSISAMNGELDGR